MRQNEKGQSCIRARLRVVLGPIIALGPGKIELLKALEETGTITGACGRMGMSYMRAWTLIRTMNRCFRGPVVVAVRGGTRGGGGARLTETGREALRLYRRMDDKCGKVIQGDWQELKKLLKAGPGRKSK